MDIDNFFRQEETKKDRISEAINSSLQSGNKLRQEREFQSRTFTQVVEGKLFDRQAACPDKKFYVEYNGQEISRSQMESGFVIIETEEGLYVGHPSQMVFCIKEKKENNNET